MAKNLRLPIAGLVLLIIGIGVVGFAATFGPLDRPQEYNHEVEFRYAPPPDSPEVHSFSSLSEQAQEIFLRCVENENAKITVEGQGNQIKEFEYARSTPQRGGGVYYIEYKGDVWQFILTK